METYAAERLATGFSWTECPRWHDGRFHFSDMYNHRIVALSPAGEAEVLVDLGDRDALDGAEVVLAGTGFLPDGRLLVNSMFERVVLAVSDGKAELYADLRGLAAGPINDMVVAADGRAYITQLGFDLWAGEQPAPSPIIIVEPGGAARIAAGTDHLLGANGIALTADGGTLVTAEAFAEKIVAFTVGADGELSDYRLFADIGELPDGMCLDAEGAAWVALPVSSRVLRVADGGEVLAQVTVPQGEAGCSTACDLGGDDRKTLYIACGFEVFDFAKSREGAQGSIWTARVDVAGGGTRP
ncbi:SMP-30/gluconolactonase/LRE family protein [Actinomadura rudentiformis]|uniref:SMP-30/gluconolactonase/LRE family protein n=1 Tax=Actinomadura rudentiformis TaxID=359158 RepID=A0A6H9Y969_9ACTN|nr:SMP-30/gluconolactonase/LRE family protein [Actinomadura rudentiformis]KAB2341564.1 SMP-30/gluconolactonase/LRE family protein [Actinomadura rudentiformis]